MLIQVSQATARSSLWSRVRFQLGGGILVAVLVPWFARVHFVNAELERLSLQAALVGTLFALIGGYYCFRRLVRYPGVRASNPIFPSFAVSYLIVLAIFFFLRLDYSRLQFLVSFLICIVWYYFVYFKLQRQQGLRIGVVPFGHAGSLLQIGEVQWVVLNGVGDYDNRVDAIAADLRADLSDEWNRFLADRALDGTLVMHVKQVVESLTGRVAIEHLSENNFGSLIPGIVYAKIKQLGDVAAAAIAIPLLIPVFLVVAIAVRLDSNGPVFFRQTRVGYRGEEFTIWKFRTMRHAVGKSADPRASAMTGDDDWRVTRIGKILRNYRIDELPQVFNILKGEMSWIGPRPEAVPLSRWYENELPFYRYRHIVKPGITGWAQVKQGHVADVDDVLWKLHYDFYYIKNFSFWLDILIVAGTIRTVVTGFGSR